jgi:alkylation response protein AidB-like acyl-CoA dehydrogenase
MEIDEFKPALDAWLDEHSDELAPEHGGVLTMDDEMTQIARVRRLLFDAGWTRYGWPERVGGLGGSGLLRAYLGEALMERDLVEPGIYSMPEVMAPTMIDFASPALALEMVPKLLSGEENWCQGFSEPSTGSNLGSLSCRAEATEEGWRVTGQKVWTSFAQYSARCVLLTRTGEQDSAHRGITALFVDLDTPGITVRPFETMHGLDEFSEVFFDDALVPFERTLGERDKGWSVAMDLLPYERSTSLWHRAAFLRRRFDQLLKSVEPGALDPRRVGEVAELLFAFRARSRATQLRLAAGGKLGAETSVDKVLVATAEQAVFDLVAEGLATEVAIGDDPRSHRWRSEFLYSRASTIYGGTAEIQRNIIARRLLDLGSDR